MNEFRRNAHPQIHNLHLHIAFIFFLILSTRVSQACHDNERIALLSIKNPLIDPSGRLYSWQIDRHLNCCEWHGIQCSVDKLHVISIDLRNIDLEMNLQNSDNESPPDTSLTGTISSSLLNLPHLEYLDLSFNNLDYSKIQYHLSKLKKLNHLDVSNSNFSGSITTQFTNVSSLQYLDISGYVQASDPTSSSYTTSPIPLISSSINWVKGLVHLRVLRLSGVDLSEATVKKNWAKPISFLTHLKQLHLSSCYISSPVFPIHEFLNLSHLSSLQMNYNENIDSPIPTQIAYLTSLSVLELTGCYNLHGTLPYLPYHLTRLDVRGNDKLHVNLTSMFERQWPKLQALWMSETNVTGSIPTSISNAPLLVSLIASSCFIQGPLPTTISSLSKLEYLDLSMNIITGNLPASVSNMKRLQYLSLFGNNFQGHIPDSICELTSLQQLDLSLNKLTKMIPSCITKLRNLSYLDISDNSIEGTVSLNSLIKELNLTHLNLNSNSITVEMDQHSVPSKFQLVSLQLQSCNISGEIPDYICKFTSLDELDLSQNNLKGNIPSCIFKHQTLTYLGLSGNNLQGRLPSVLRFNANSLMYLNLAGNKLHGSVPLPSQKNMYFDLSQNEFSGRIPFEVGERLSKARYASLSGNQLSGAIPLSFCSNKGLEFDSYSLESLDLSNNILTGIIPSSLGNCSSLSFLHLGMNNLSGYIPNKLAQVTSITYLLLHDNLLEGTFPKIIQEFERLNVLTLGNNNFRGNIPTFIGSFQNLRILSLRSNAFNGSIPKEIGNLAELQILDLSFNSLSGPIQGKVLGNLTMLTSRPNDMSALWGGGMFVSNLQLQIVIKGVLQHIQRLQGYNSGMDLSSNMLEGDIPEDIGLLKGLSMLNLSNNHFNGSIPSSVGNMTGLESLDLSSNNLSGEIPNQLASISTLGYINLSHNNLSGRVPEDDHFQSLSLDGSAFLGNEFLCGVPMKKLCLGDPISPTSSSTGDNTNLHEEDDEYGAGDKVLLFGSVILGVGVGFWGLFLGLLCRKEKWWFGYWRVVDTIAVKLAGCICKN